MKFNSLNVTVSLVKMGGRGSTVRLLLSGGFLLYFLRMASVINPELHFYEACTHPLFTGRIIIEQNKLKLFFCATLLKAYKT